LREAAAETVERRAHRSHLTLGPAQVATLRGEDVHGAEKVVVEQLLTEELVKQRVRTGDVVEPRAEERDERETSHVVGSRKCAENYFHELRKSEYYFTKSSETLRTITVGVSDSSEQLGTR
jgi:hypothetical protein